jgi:micrococcal nuclease
LLDWLFIVQEERMMKQRKWYKSAWFYLFLFFIIGYSGYLGMSHKDKGREASIGASSDIKWDENTKYIAAEVTEVVDGDTIHVLIEHKKETIRLILVDTPETKHPTKPIEPYGPEASNFTKKLLDGKQVKLVPDVSERDRYGRLLMYVWVENQLVNELLLEKGLARVAVFPPNVKYVEAFRAIQKKAQAAKRGIWSLENYVKENDAKLESKRAPSNE